MTVSMSVQASVPVIVAMTMYGSECAQCCIGHIVVERIL